MKEIRIKVDPSISDSTALRLVNHVVNKGKISHNSKGEERYCWITTFTMSDGESINVCLKDYRKTTMFYVYKD